MPSIVRLPTAAARTDTPIIPRSLLPFWLGDMGEQQLLTPGQDWLAIIKRPTQAAFASAFTDGVILDTAVTNEPIRGTVALRDFFDATRAMYDSIGFVHEINAGSRTCLEWEGKFQDKDVAGTTILNRDPTGAIESIRLYHRPYHQVLAFSVELSRRMAEIRHLPSVPNR